MAFCTEAGALVFSQFPTSAASPFGDGASILQFCFLSLQFSYRRFHGVFRCFTWILCFLAALSKAFFMGFSYFVLFSSGLEINLKLPTASIGCWVLRVLDLVVLRS